MHWRRLLGGAAALMAAGAILPSVAGADGPGFVTADPALLTLNVEGEVQPILSVGDAVEGVLFEGLPDGIGLAPSEHEGAVDVYVAHEQTTVPFRNSRDFIDASITRWTMDIGSGGVLGAELTLSSDEGYLRFCSASMATPDDGFDSHVFFANEETNDIVAVPPGAAYQPDPAIAPLRQGGYTVVVDTATGQAEPIAGMGRLNHENTVVIPGYDQLALLTTDDTFAATTSQLYLYLVDDQKDLFRDKGELMAFQVTHKNGTPVDPADPFNNANDYLDIGVDDTMAGRFIPVPKQIARGQTQEPPQEALENWSVANNVFTFIRLEDVAVDKNDSRVVYVADTGASRVVPNPDTGRLHRPSGFTGQADNGRVFQFVFNADDPAAVDSFTVLADGDTDPTHPAYVGFSAPDNIDTSTNSLMVQEDADSAQIWRHGLAGGDWTAVADVVDLDGESSGIVDASAWFGAGTWLLVVQAHGYPYVDQAMDGDVVIKREEGQLLLMTIPGS